MTTRHRTILLCIALAAFLTCACIDLDIDRSGFEATATASVWTEAEVRATAAVERE